jgi:hypothetical protein
MSSNPLPSFSNLEIITEDSEDASTSAIAGNARNHNSTSSGPSASKPESKGKKGDLPPLPTSLKQAKHLLATKAHVNLKDYMAARNKVKNNSSKDNVPKTPAKNFAHLVHPSHWALIKYTRKTGKIIPRNKAKNEWLQPMLKEIY